MKFEVASYLVLDNNQRYRTGAEYDRTINGYCLFNIGAYVPIIVKGVGCIGTARIRTILLSKDTTSVRFVYNPINEKEGEVHYTMYRNIVSNMSDEDYEFSQDAIIPGLATGKKKKNPYAKSSLSSIFDDDDDDDDDGPRPTKYPW